VKYFLILSCHASSSKKVYIFWSLLPHENDMPCFPLAIVSDSINFLAKLVLQKKRSGRTRNHQKLLLWNISFKKIFHFVSLSKCPSEDIIFRWFFEFQKLRHTCDKFQFKQKVWHFFWESRKDFPLRKLFHCEKKFLNSLLDSVRIFFLWLGSTIGTVAF